MVPIRQCMWKLCTTETAHGYTRFESEESRKCVMGRKAHISCPMEQSQLNKSNFKAYHKGNDVWKKSIFSGRSISPEFHVDILEPFFAWSIQVGSAAKTSTTATHFALSSPKHYIDPSVFWISPKAKRQNGWAQLSPVACWCLPININGKK